MTSVVDYVGRTIDLSMFDNVQEQGESLLAQEIASEDNFGLICTGVQKVVQKVTLRFCTIRESMLHLPLEGCEFFRDMMVGRFRSTVDVFASFSEAKATIIEQCQSEELDTDPDDERLADMELLDVTLSMDFLGLRIRIITVAGTSRAVIIPIPVIV